MSKFLIEARIAELSKVNTVSASGAASSAAVVETLLRRWYKVWHFLGAAPLETDVNTTAASHSIDHESGVPDTVRSPLYDMATSNPHVIAATLFSGNRR
jgi:hypothetical protein